MLADWLYGYLEYTGGLESPKVMNLWAGISLVSSALQKKVKFSLGRISVYPNFYIVLVGPPGSRKNQVITEVVKFIDASKVIYMSADAPTREIFMHDFAECSVETPMDGGKVLRHSSIFVGANELASFLGEKKTNARFVEFLTDIFDSPERTWEYRTKNRGKAMIPSAYLNVLAATTPASISDILPLSAIGTGFTSRIIFVCCQNKDRDVAFPEETDEVRRMRQALLCDLIAMSSIKGTYHFTPTAKKFWIDVYPSINGQTEDSICKDPNFANWYQRKPLFTLKLSVILRAAKGNDLLVGVEEIERALKYLEEVEGSMHRAFAFVGRSEFTADSELLFNLVKKYRVIQETKLRGLVWRDMDDRKFQNVIQTVVKTGKVVVDSMGPPIVYKWIG